MKQAVPHATGQPVFDWKRYRRLGGDISGFTKLSALAETYQRLYLVISTRGNLSALVLSYQHLEKLISTWT